MSVTPAEFDSDVSRAARKLRGALRELSIQPRDWNCIDVGASTGGFTQVLLDSGARHVVAIDVGTDQLVDQLRTDPRVRSLEGTHVGHLQRGDVAPADLVVVDLSFISLRHVFDALAELTAQHGLLLPMVKPQFEVGRSGLDKHGVVTLPHRRRDAVFQVIDEAERHGFSLQGLCASPLPGPSGNREYFVLLARNADPADRRELWETAAALD